tara:strand:+ start:2216 stop:2494 length:279 start_codon:yes stop_codon:yes gene_type:complete
MIGKDVDQVDLNKAKNVVTFAVSNANEIKHDHMLVLVRQPLVKGDIPEAEIKAVGKTEVVNALSNNPSRHDLHLLEQVSNGGFVKLPFECLA